MSSAAAASWTTSHAARWAAGQWRRNSSSTASPSPRWAARTSAASVRRLSGRPTRSLPATASCTAISSVDIATLPPPDARDPERARADLRPLEVARRRAGAATIRIEKRIAAPRHPRRGDARRRRAARGPAGTRRDAGPRRCSRTRTTTLPSRLASRNSRRGRGVPLGAAARAAGPAGRDPHRVVRRPRRRSRQPAGGGGGGTGWTDERVEQRLGLAPPVGATPRARTSRRPGAPGPARPRRPSSRGRSTRASTGRPEPEPRGPRAAASPARAGARPSRGSRAAARARRRRGICRRAVSGLQRRSGASWRSANVAAASRCAGSPTGVSRGSTARQPAGPSTRGRRMAATARHRRRAR